MWLQNKKKKTTKVSQEDGAGGRKSLAALLFFPHLCSFPWLLCCEEGALEEKGGWGKRHPLRARAHTLQAHAHTGGHRLTDTHTHSCTKLARLEHTNVAVFFVWSPRGGLGPRFGPGEMAQPILGQGSLQPASAAGLASLELDSSLDQYVQIRIFKIIVIGDSNVGKTCLTFRFCGGTFPDKTEATIGVDFREKTVEIEGEKIKVMQTAWEGKRRD